MLMGALMDVQSLFFSIFEAYGFSSGNYWSTMIRDICAALCDSGTPCDAVELHSTQSAQEYLGVATRQYRRFIATFNFISPFPNINIGGKSIFMQELFPAQSITIFIDHPVHLARTIVTFEEASRSHKFRPAPAPPPIYGVMEPGHATLLHDLGIEPRRVFVFPQAGPKPVAATAPIAQRRFDYVFYGSIANLVSDEEFLSKYGISSQLMRMIADDVLNCALTGYEDVYSASKRRFSEIGFSGDFLRIAEFAKIIDIRARLIRRWKLLNALSELEIHYIGDVCDEFKMLNRNGVYHGKRSFSDVIEFLGNCKVSINDSINLRNAALMRHYYAMANGCVSATESGNWVRDEFSDRNVVMLDPETDAVSRLRGVIADMDAAQQIADAGRALQIERHQWRNRIDPLLQTLGQFDLAMSDAVSG
jgi:hypothetical protein